MVLCTTIWRKYAPSAARGPLSWVREYSSAENTTRPNDRENIPTCSGPRCRRASASIFAPAASARESISKTNNTSSKNKIVPNVQRGTILFLIGRVLRTTVLSTSSPSFVGRAAGNSCPQCYAWRCRRGTRSTFLKNLVGVPGIEPGLHAPHACVLPVYYSPSGRLKQGNKRPN